eukprot:CFRG6904T1
MVEKVDAKSSKKLARSSEVAKIVELGHLTRAEKAKRKSEIDDDFEKSVEERKAAKRIKRQMRAPKEKEHKPDKTATKESNKDTSENAEEAVTISPNAAALAFLDTWKNDKDNWKYQKVRNTYILKNMYDPYKIPKESFKIVLEYLDGLKGKARQITQEAAEAELSKMSEKSTEDMTEVEQTIHKIILYRCKKIAQRTST